MTDLSDPVWMAKTYIERAGLVAAGHANPGEAEVMSDFSVVDKDGETLSIASHMRKVLQAAELFPVRPSWHEERQLADAAPVVGAVLAVAMERDGMIDDLAPEISQLADIALLGSVVVHG